MSRLRNDLYCVEWDVKPYSIPYRILLKVTYLLTYLLIYILDIVKIIICPVIPIPSSD